MCSSQPTPLPGMLFSCGQTRKEKGAETTRLASSLALNDFVYVRFSFGPEVHMTLAYLGPRPEENLETRRGSRANADSPRRVHIGCVWGAKSIGGLEEGGRKPGPEKSERVGNCEIRRTPPKWVSFVFVCVCPRGARRSALFLLPRAW